MNTIEAEEKRDLIGFIYIVWPDFDKKQQWDEHWKSIKYLAGQRGYITQCISAFNAQRMMSEGNDALTLAGNVVTKLNDKMGGVSWHLHKVSNLVTEFISEDRPTLFLSADVAHPPPKANRQDEESQLSVVAVVGSGDTDQWNFMPIPQLQEPRLEYIVRMKEAVQTSEMDSAESDRAVQYRNRSDSEESKL